MLDKNRLKAKFIMAMNEQAEADDANAARDRIADAMAQAIVEEITQLKINYTAGLTAPNGAVGGVLNHTIS